jgi:ABC-type transport system involved in cytochrome c biogenesis ATPase subunit
LLEDTAVVGNGIRTTIAEKTPIPRRELFGELCRLIEASPLVFVTGAAGSGKSAVVKSAFTTATQGGVGFAFRAVSLTGHHINEVLHRFGLTLAALQAQTAMHGRKVLWVDSLGS